jgi:hypothetical protein
LQREHIFEKYFQGHGVHAALVGKEELTVALEFAIDETYVVTIIVAAEGHIEGIEPKAIAFLGVTLGLLDLPDHSIVHA